MASFLDSIFGSKPEVAPYVPTDLTTEQINAILANISAFPDISQLGDLYQTYMTQAFNEAIPGFSDILASGGQVTKEMLAQAEPLLRGEIPEDVKAQIGRSSAYQSLLSGTAGSPMASALTARDLGTTSLGLIQQGAQLAGEAGNAAQRWAGLASGLIMNPQGMMITPEQLAQFKMQNRLLEQATQQFKYNVAAAPNPALQALNQWVEQVGGSIIASYAGGGGGSRGANYQTQYNPNQYGSNSAFSFGGGGGYGDWSGNVGQGTGMDYGSGYNFGGY